MSADYELEVLARARMRQHREAAQRLRNIARVEKTACEPPKVLTGFSLGHLLRLFATRRRIPIDRQRPVHGEP